MNHAGMELGSLRGEPHSGANAVLCLADDPRIGLLLTDVPDARHVRLPLALSCQGSQDLQIVVMSGTNFSGQRLFSSQGSEGDARTGQLVEPQPKRTAAVVATQSVSSLRPLVMDAA